MPESVMQLGSVPFTEAIRAARARNVALPNIYYDHLQGQARSTAFSVAGLSKLDQIQQVQDSLAQAIESGATFETWKKELLKSPQALALPDHRLDNIFRTNIQAAYARGRWEKTKRNKASRPYLMYSAINDTRTRPHHAAMDGMVAPVDDPIWDSWWPPSGYRCRCSTISLNERQAERRRQRDEQRQKDNPALRQERLNARPDKGWDYHPGKEPTEGVRRAINQRQARCREQAFARKRRGRCLDRTTEILEALRRRIDPEQQAGDRRAFIEAMMPAVLRAESTQAFANLWRRGQFEAHVKTRQRYNHIQGEGEYIDRIADILAGANLALLADIVSGRPQLAVESDLWAVVFQQGDIVSAYRKDRKGESFVIRHTRLGNELREVIIDDDVRDLLQRLSVSYRELRR